MAGGGEVIDPLDEEEEEEEEGLYDDFQDNLNSHQPGNQSINVHSAVGVGSSDQHSPATAIRRSPAFSLKEIGPELSSPIGLTLRKTPSFEELLENRLSALSQAHPSRDDNEGSSDRYPPRRPRGRRRRRDNVGSLPMSQKLTASNFPIKYINIGTWEMTSKHEGHLVAKLYYAKKRIVWEILAGTLKNKIEMVWSDISAIRANMQDNEVGLLQIELSKPPSFSGETDPQPRKHTIWHLVPDFTDRQASTFRIHTVVFPSGVLNTHYQKLLSCDSRLLELSQQPFPSQPSLHFDLESLFEDPKLPCTCNSSSASSAALQYPYQSHHTMSTRATPARQTPSLATTVLNFALQNELSRKMDTYTVGNQGIDWRNINVGIGRPQLVSSQAQDNMAMITSSNYHRVAMALNNIEEHLLGDPQVVWADESTSAAHVQSMRSTMHPTDDPCQSRTNCQINHTASTSRIRMLNGNQSYNVQRLHGFCSQAMNCQLLPPPSTPNDPIGTGLEVNNVVLSEMPNNPADVVPYMLMPPRNPTNRVSFPTVYCSRDSRIE